MAGNIIHRPFTRVPGRIKDGHKGTGLGNVRSDGGPCHAHAEVIDEYNVQHHVDGACDKQEIEGRLAAGSNYQKLGPAPVEHFAPAHQKLSAKFPSKRQTVPAENDSTSGHQTDC